jgi:DNA-binding response OmpR family regulator
MSTSEATSPDRRRVLLVSGDLMSGSWIGGPAKQAGLAVDVATSLSDGLQKAAASDYRLVIIDLAFARGKIAELASAARTRSPSAEVIAFGPHVQDALLEAAQAAGCDRVLTRGQFSAHVAKILAELQ